MIRTVHINHQKKDHHMRAADQLAIIVISILNPARAAGMPEEEAEAVYDGLMERYSIIQDMRSEFAEDFLDAIQRAITVARGGNGGAMFHGGFN